MPIGKRNRLVTIKAPPAGTDALGQPSGGWTTHCTAWANIRHENGVETLRAGAITSRGRASIRIAYRADMTTAMRVHHGATVYEIKAVLPDEQRRQHVDLAVELLV